MPKVYMSDAARAQAASDAADDAIRLVVATRRMKHGITQREICQSIGMSAPTFCKRMKNPCSMTFIEFRRLANVLRMTDAEIGRCIGALGKGERECLR